MACRSMPEPQAAIAADSRAATRLLLALWITLAAVSSSSCCCCSCRCSCCSSAQRWPAPGPPATPSPAPAPPSAAFGPPGIARRASARDNASRMLDCRAQGLAPAPPLLPGLEGGPPAAEPAEGCSGLPCTEVPSSPPTTSTAAGAAGAWDDPCCSSRSCFWEARSRCRRAEGLTGCVASPPQLPLPPPHSQPSHSSALIAAAAAGPGDSAGQAPKGGYQWWLPQDLQCSAADDVRQVG